MSAFLALLQRIFLYRRGRPVALLILLWTTSLCVVSELPLDSRLREIAGNFVRPFSSSRQFLFDSYQKYQPRIPLSQPVTIVAIDEASLAHVGQWPWPRNKLADLLETIAAYQPAAIGLDMYMPEPDQTSPGVVAKNLPPGAPANLARELNQLPSHETQLASALASVPSVLGAAGFDFETFTSSAGLLSAPVLTAGGDALPHVRRFGAVLASLPELQAAAWGQAILSVDLDFGVVRRIPLVVGVGEVLVSGLAMEMLRVATDSPAVRITVGDHGVSDVSIADLVVPTQSDGAIWLHFARAEDTAGRYVSAAEILQGTVDPEQLTGKLVLLGLTGSGLHDMRTTALRELVPGIEIQAQVLETMFDGRFLLRPWWMKWVEVISILTIGCLLVWFIPRTDSALAGFLKTVPRASMWLTLGLNMLLVTLGFLLFSAIGLLFDASSFFIILSGIMGSLVSSALIEIEREARAEAEQQQQIREAAKLVAGGFASSIGESSRRAGCDQPERISQWTRMLAQQASADPAFSTRLSPELIDHISRAAPHRDIGMMRVPAEILHSKSQLTPAQRKIMQQHTQVGSIAIDAVQDVLDIDELEDPSSARQYLHYVREIAEGHHERWDGHGYPQGIAGESIPIAARIAAIIDTYNSLVSDRPQRAAISHAAAVDEVKRGAGSQFDPRLVESFLEIAPAMQVID